MTSPIALKMTTNEDDMEFPQDVKELDEKLKLVRGVLADLEELRTIVERIEAARPQVEKFVRRLERVVSGIGLDDALKEAEKYLDREGSPAAAGE